MPLVSKRKPESNESSTPIKKVKTIDVTIDGILILNRSPLKWASFGRNGSVSNRISLTYKNNLGRIGTISVWEKTESADDLESSMS